MAWFNEIVNKDAETSQGTDGSGEYTRSRNVRFIIGQTATGAVVSFKPFLSSFGMKFESQYTDKTNDYQGLNAKRVFANASLFISYEISLELLAHSVNEARMNLRRINEMGKMFQSVFSSPPTKQNMDKSVLNSYFISFSNIISSQFIPEQSISSFEDLKTQGVPCFIDSFNFSIDKDMGYFEDKTLVLLPKKQTITFSFKVSNAAYEYFNQKYLWLPIQPNGEYYKKDIKSFPFGISSNKGPIGKDGSNSYAGNKRGYIYIAKTPNVKKDKNGKVTRIDSPKETLLGFKPFINDIKYDLSYPNVKVKELEEKGGSYQLYNQASIYTSKKLDFSFSIINHSVNEANNNMRKIQTILRITDGYFPKQDPNTGSVIWKAVPSIAPSIYLVFSDYLMIA